MSDLQLGLLIVIGGGIVFALHLDPVRRLLSEGFRELATWLQEHDRLHKWGPLVGLGLLTVIVAGTYAHVFAGEPCGDDNSHHFGEITRLAQAMKAGDWDWWNPSGNSGFPSGYYYQVLPQAVPAALSALTGLSPLTCFQLGIFIPLVLAPAVGYRAMRILGAKGWVALGAAVAIPFCTGGDLMMLGNDSARWGHGADGTFSVGLYTQLWAFVAFPLALAHASRWIDEGKGLNSALAWGIVVGLCHPFAGVAVGLAVAVGTGWVALRWLNRWTAGPRARIEGWPEVPSPKRPTLRLFVLGALLVIGSACAWLPVLVDYDGFGGFPHRVVDEIGPGFKLLVRWLVYGNLLDYARAPVLTVLLPIVILFARASWLPRMWGAALVYALLLGVGPHLGKTDDDLLPSVRFLGSLQVVLAMAIGGGFVVVMQRIWEGWRELRMSIMQRAWIAVTVAIPLVLVLVGGSARQRERVRVASDFKGVHHDDMMALMPAIRAAPPGRIQARAGADSHWAVMLPYAYADRPASLVMGGAALQSSPNYVYQWELRDIDPELEAYVFDSPLVMLKKAQEDEVVGGEVIFEGDIYQLRLFPTPGLVGPVQVVGELPAGRKAERAETVRWLWSDMPQRDQVLAHHGSGPDGPPPRGKTLWSKRAGSSISAEVEAEAATTFAIRESWHPRWEARLDGEPVPIRRITPDYMAIDVPPGTHTISVHFDRALWTWLLWLLWPGLVAGAWAWARWQARRAQAAS